MRFLAEIKVVMSLKMFFIIIALLSINDTMHALFTQDRAAHLMQKGEFEKAKPLLQKMVVNAPDNPEILYDAGVASYKTKEYKQAAAYFKQAAQMPSAALALKEKAYFNSANAAVALKDFETAKNDYENVLKINPNNERAQYNLVMVEEMQEQEEEKDETKKEDKENKEDKDKQKKQEKDDSGQDQKDKEKSEQSKQSKDEQPGKDKQDEKNKDQKNNDDAGKKDEEQEKREQQQKQEKADAEKIFQKDKEGKEQSAQEQQEEEKNIASHLVKILDEQEKKDAALHKMMVKQAVNNNMAGHNGQNNW